MIECLIAAKLPKGVCNLVMGRREVVGAELVLNPNVDKISFTGSVAMSQHIMREGIATTKRARWNWAASRPRSCWTMPLSTRRFPRLSSWLS